MLFKRLHKHIEKNPDEKATKDQEVVEEKSEDELVNERLKIWKKIQRKQKMKKSVVLFFLVFAIIGGYKSLLETTPATEYEEISDEVFVRTYMEAYFEYPQSEESKKVISVFTLKNEEVVNYPEELESLRVSKINFYKVKSLKQEYKSYRYYAEIKIEIKLQDQEPTIDTMYVRADVAKEGDRYAITRPLLFTSYDVKGISDEEILGKLTLEKESTNQQLSDDEHKQVKQTLNLFFKTYSDDYKQAKLLTTSSHVIDKLDPHVEIKLQTITSATQDDDYMYLQVKVDESDKYVTRTRNYYIEIKKENNKIKKMEVY
ncbi:hypothetical protein M2475_001617 [Breznakia sp. PF5-3]|uniref:hypothetical protein n=1 Tax=unclassified Breznakia TaxID=2623764 RepID=UPI0024073779|nr:MULTISPECIES: hypothetical protein [unclassified Breznakia]MDF9825183.1 hypothetical protein [Breznakia sp. PM6-1]MDF9836041.1 hypothetical protein [Breznakia sp. PF5-3]MDF9838598.1 hypothetical protein [Breznakia sp. PFB2-8]MDF9860633.1 hypothetical protein [Breznakia sp. PH5-24]